MKGLFSKLFAVMMIAVFALTGCSKSGKPTDNKPKAANTVTLAGSTSMEKLCEALVESFRKDHPDMTVTVEYTGSGAGIEALAKGSIDIGNASRALKDSERQAGIVENVVAIDGIAVILDKKNPVSNLTVEQLSAIYTGKVKNWKELGGPDQSIVVIGRENGSGTRGAFEELLKIKDVARYAQQLDSTGGVLAKVAATPGAIGYVSLDVVGDTVKAVSLNNIAATKENIQAGKYMLARPFVMATKGNISEQNKWVRAWFEYVRSAKGQEIISKMGLILPNK